MKKIILTFVVITLISVTPSVSAKSWSNQGARDDRQQNREQLSANREAMRQQILSERENLRKEWQEGTIEAADKLGELHAENLSKRSAFYYNRLTGILARLDQAIKDAEAKYSVAKLAKSRSNYNESKAKLDSAKTLADAAITAFRNITGGSVSEARTALIAAREKAKNAWATYKDATKLMKDSVKELRTVIRANEPKPSRSPRASDDPQAIPDLRKKVKPSFVPVVPPPQD